MEKFLVGSGDMVDKSQVHSIHPVTGRIVVETVNVEPSMTQQQFKDDCDINNIMRKYQSTGEFTHVTSKRGIYADFTEIKDYQGMLHTVMEADAAFMTLPAEVRARFRNDPGSLISFLQDGRNRDEAVRLGLLAKDISANDSTNADTSGPVSADVKSSSGPKKADSTPKA